MNRCFWPPGRARYLESVRNNALILKTFAKVKFITADGCDDAMGVKLELSREVCTEIGNKLMIQNV